jgi:P27 family predicted phage terminase small subunit
MYRTPSYEHFLAKNWKKLPALNPQGYPMGRPPKPIERHKLIGSYRPDRHNPDAPTYPAAVPDAPAWLLPDAREHWHHLVGVLAGSNVLADAHAVALGMLCNSLTRYREVSDVLDREGVVVTDAKGNLRRHPASLVLNRLHDQCMAGLIQFGLTPASVHRVSARPAADDAGNDTMDSVLRLADAEGK